MRYTDTILIGSDTMAKLKSRVNRFFYRNRDKGIPNLMLIIAVGCGLVYISYLLNIEDPFFAKLLAFDRELIFRGQVWRLFTYPLNYLVGTTPFLGFLSLFFFYF